jgi:hypothetical protein
MPVRTILSILAPSLVLALAIGCSEVDAPASPEPGAAPAAAPLAESATPTSTVAEATGAGADCAGGECAGNCGHAAAPVAQAAPVAPGSGTQAAPRTFGDDLDESRAVTPLSTLLARPAEFDGKVVKTEGVIAAVCQRMGCWMELRADEGGPVVRVPMAGHSFFLPRDVAGRRATVEGTVEVRVLDQGTQDHLRTEGAQAADQALGIAASGVVVHGA